MLLQVRFQMCPGPKLTDVCSRTFSGLDEGNYVSLGRGQKKRERVDQQNPLGAMYESENAIGGTEAAKNDRRMTVWLLNDT